MFKIRGRVLGSSLIMPLDTSLATIKGETLTINVYDRNLKETGEKTIIGTLDVTAYEPLNDGFGLSTFAVPEANQMKKGMIVTCSGVYGSLYNDVMYLNAEKVKICTKKMDVWSELRGIPRDHFAVHKYEGGFGDKILMHVRGEEYLGACISDDEWKQDGVIVEHHEIPKDTSKYIWEKDGMRDPALKLELKIIQWKDGKPLEPGMATITMYKEALRVFGITNPQTWAEFGPNILSQVEYIVDGYVNGKKTAEMDINQTPPDMFEEDEPRWGLNIGCAILHVNPEWITNVGVQVSPKFVVTEAFEGESQLKSKFANDNPYTEGNDYFNLNEFNGPLSKTMMDSHNFYAVHNGICDAKKIKAMSLQKREAALLGGGDILFRGDPLYNIFAIKKAQGTKRKR